MIGTTLDTIQHPTKTLLLIILFKNYQTYLLILIEIMSTDGKLVKGKRGSKVPRNGLKVLSFTVLRDNKQIVQRSTVKSNDTCYSN